MQMVWDKVLGFLQGFLASLINEWWDFLSIDLQIFYIIGLASTALLVIQSGMMLIGGIGDTDMPDDVDGDIGDGGEIRVLSVKTVTAFFVGFGWTGVICLKNDLPLWAAILIAMLVGGSFMAMVLYMMKALFGLRESGNIDYRNAIGQVGTVYMPIPPKQTGMGQVEINIQGRVRFVDAYTNSENKLSGNARVKIVDVVNPLTVLVEPFVVKPENEKEEQ